MPKPPPKAPTSTTSWTKPEPTDVIHYRFLWTHEADEGREDGRNARPCLVLGTRETAKGLVVHIAPITTRRLDPANSLAILPAVIRHLSLYDRSMIVTSEYNSFVWIGPDVFPRADGLVYYGKVPERLFEAARNAALAKRARSVGQAE
jgi:hypothetical protein